MINGQCHCGNVVMEMEKLPKNLTSCNCSVCNRIGALWGYYAPKNVKVTVRELPTSIYLWGEENIELHHCQQCGCMTHYLTTEKCPDTRIGVNFRMMELSITKPIPIRRFDGADSWQYLDET